MLTPLKQLTFSVILAMLLGAASSACYALDGESATGAKMSMHEVAMQIRQYKSWQILNASSVQKASGHQYFRFKLLRSDGKVKIINIDPNNPNLRTLEQ